MQERSNPLCKLVGLGPDHKHERLTIIQRIDVDPVPIAGSEGQRQLCPTPVVCSRRIPIGVNVATCSPKIFSYITDDRPRTGINQENRRHRQIVTAH